MSNGYFGIPTLKILLKKKNIKINYIITSKKNFINSKPNLIKKISKKYNIKIINSDKIEKTKNIIKINNSKPDLILIISFKIISKKIWRIPRLGTINIHPSLLPNYKGPCPINWAIINNEKYTGLTSFFINDNIDGGPIILQKKIKINSNIDFISLYKLLSIYTKKFVLKTILYVIKKKRKKLKNNFLIKNLKKAPKINNYFSKISFYQIKEKINKLILGLPSNKPAWCFLNIYKDIYIFNIYKINININKKDYKYLKLNYYKSHIGDFIYYKKKIFIKIKNDFIELLICQLNNRKKMNILNLYNGLKFKNFKNIFLF